MSSRDAAVIAFLCGACAAEPRTSRRAEPSSSAAFAGIGASVARVELCKTTEAELASAFGPPMRDGRLGRYRVQSWALGKDPERILAVLLDARAIVVDISWDIPGVLTWIPRDACAPGG